MQAVGLVGQTELSAPASFSTEHFNCSGIAERAGFSGSSVSVGTHTEKTENTLRKCRTNYQQGLPTTQTFSQKEEFNQFFSK